MVWTLSEAEVFELGGDGARAGDGLEHLMRLIFGRRTVEQR